MQATKKEIKKMKEDKAFWEGFLPHGWKLFAWTNKDIACFISPRGREVEIDGEFISSCYDTFI